MEMRAMRVAERDIWIAIALGWSAFMLCFAVVVW
jgi:hypothetical protein